MTLSRFRLLLYVVLGAACWWAAYASLAVRVLLVGLVLLLTHGIIADACARRRLRTMADETAARIREKGNMNKQHVTQIVEECASRSWPLSR